MNTEPEPNPHVALNNAREQARQEMLIKRPTGTEALAWILYADSLERLRILMAKKNKERRSSGKLAKVAAVMLAALSFLPLARADTYSTHATPAPEATPPNYDRLPNDCAIVAARAVAQLSKSSAWSRVLWLRFIDFKNYSLHGHALVVWQMFPSGTTYVYDSSGTFELQTKSRTVGDIVFELNSKMNSRFYIYEAHYAE
jgi:hypothetical protein